MNGIMQIYADAKCNQRCKEIAANMYNMRIPINTIAYCTSFTEQQVLTIVAGLKKQRKAN